MKKVKVFHSFILVYVFNYLSYPVYSNPTEKSRDEKVEYVEADIKNIDTTKFHISTFPDYPEVRIIAPIINNVIKLITINGHTLWEITTHSRCLNFLTFSTSSDKIFIVLHTSYDEYKYFTNLVYDPTETSNPGTSGVESIPQKSTYMGITPFIIALNREFGRYNEYEKEIWGTKLSIEDIFDKWYFKYSSKNIRLCNIRGRTTLKYEKYEPNDCERFLMVTDKRVTVWSSKEDSDSQLQPCKKVEVYRDLYQIKLMRLTLARGSSLHFKYNQENNKWNQCEQTDFEETLSDIGFTESKANSEDSDQSGLATNTKSNLPSNSDGNTDQESGKAAVGLATSSIDSHGLYPGITRLDIAEIDPKDYHFIKNRLSSYRILTIIPKKKRYINEITFRGNKLYPVKSDDYKIIFMKQMNAYYIEILLRDRDTNYVCYYCDTILNQQYWYHYYQFIFYQQILVEAEKYDVQSCITYNHFNLLDELIKTGDPTNTNKFSHTFPFNNVNKEKTTGVKKKYLNTTFLSLYDCLKMEMKYYISLGNK
ncbi:conserved hypothetical protein [Theileria orientalis strain Shintoku]|uniref:Uncharacterized protein n=1 Tax=Theileria orientalis strain Shintoku TaxID=869250 RepID=J4DPX6_THEOR|nr:conserved hypothetical protein [Theileria orientalis strain Shintoku]BAM41469.1 conserved hypothetical protein [Theileria orientalis strain Shintoku]|eukprot:XP_009691770.1 conserved hypothetical protein [Theileria orientalis strain Shintoku]